MANHFGLGLPSLGGRCVNSAASRAAIALETFNWELEENTDAWLLEDGSGNWVTEESV